MLTGRPCDELVGEVCSEGVVCEIVGDPLGPCDEGIVCEIINDPLGACDEGIVCDILHDPSCLTNPVACVPPPDCSGDCVSVKLGAAGGVAVGTVEFVDDPTGLGIRPQKRSPCKISLAGNWTGECVGFCIGEWRWQDANSCPDFSMTYLESSSTLHYLTFGSSQDGSTDSCTDCTLTINLNNFYCYVCNGKWKLTSDHVLVIPPGFRWREVIPECTASSERRLDCHLETNVVHLGV